MSTRPKSLAVLLTTLWLAVMASGCLLGSSSITKYSGQFVADETLSRIKVGDNQHFVISLLGEPTSRTEVDDLTIWKYAYTRTTTEKKSVLVVISSRNTTEITGAAYVEFDADQLVTRTWSVR